MSASVAASCNLLCIRICIKPANLKGLSWGGYQFLLMFNPPNSKQGKREQHKQEVTAIQLILQWQQACSACMHTAVRYCPSFPDSSHLFRIGSTDPPSMRRRRQIFCSLSGALAGKNLLSLIVVEGEIPA